MQTNENEGVGMSNPRVLIKATCAGKEFSILQYSTVSGHRYVVGETGVQIMFTFKNINDAYEMMIKRMHLRYSLEEVTTALKGKELCEE